MARTATRVTMLSVSSLRSVVAVVATAGVILVGCASTPGATPQLTPGEVSPSAQPTTTSRIADLQTKLGLGYMREGRMELAYEHLTRAVEADPNYSSAHLGLALCLERLGAQERAETHYAQAVRVDGNDSSARNNYGRFLCQSGRHEEGLAQIEGALANPLYQNRTAALVNAGLCARGNGDKRRAETYLRGALERSPNLGAALLPMAELTFDEGNYLSTRAYLQRYAAARPLPAGHLLLGYRAEVALGNRDGAEEYASALKTAYPDSEEAVNLTGDG